MEEIVEEKVFTDKEIETVKKFLADKNVQAFFEVDYAYLESDDKTNIEGWIRKHERHTYSMKIREYEGTGGLATSGEKIGHDLDDVLRMAWNDFQTSLRHKEEEHRKFDEFAREEEMAEREY